MSQRTIIIGGGGVGSSIAYFLACGSNSDDEVSVVERDPTYRSASSSLSASSIRQQFSTPVNVQLSQFGYTFMRECSEGGGPGAEVGLVARGYLFLARREQAVALKSRTQHTRALGVAIGELTQRQLAQRYPWLDGSDIVYASIGTEGEGWFDGYMLQQLYRNRARAHGVKYIHGNVVGLAIRQSKIVGVQLGTGQCLVADRVVNAAGPWSATVARMAGVELPVRARRRTAFVISCPTSIPEFPILIDDSGIFVRPEQHHFLCVLSPPPELDYDDLPLEPDVGIFEERIWPTLARRVPAFEELRVERAWAGYYDFNTADQNGLVGQVGPDNFYVATGFSGHGLMHSAGVGRGLAELLTQGEYKTLDLSPLSPSRLAAGQLIMEEAIY